MEQYFVEKSSVVRRIWGKSDTVLFIFAGASAEFAVNKAVDWLYFTGKLPADPLGRLFSTVHYARKIVFSSTDQANKAIDTIRKIHSSVEQSRGTHIPDWAYRDVLFMLIHYSIASYELLEKELSDREKAEVYNVFYRVGQRMGLKDLPTTYREWLPSREAHLLDNTKTSAYTCDLFKQYKKHLGSLRYRILIEGQKLVVPDRVRDLLSFRHYSLLRAFVPIYKLSRLINIDKVVKNLLLPHGYNQQIKELDLRPG